MTTFSLFPTRNTPQSNSLEDRLNVAHENLNAALDALKRAYGKAERERATARYNAALAELKSVRNSIVTRGLFGGAS